jgi:hypothetical protein
MHAEDLKVGDWITVLSWKPVSPPIDYDPCGGWGGGSGKALVDRSWVGDVLEVLAIDHPFVAVRTIKAGTEFRVSLDTRQVNLKLLSKEFVVACLGKKIVVTRGKEDVDVERPI